MKGRRFPDKNFINTINSNKNIFDYLNKTTNYASKNNEKIKLNNNIHKPYNSNEYLNSIMFNNHHYFERRIVNNYFTCFLNNKLKVL